MLISEKIFEIIKEKGMSQKEFARHTGIAESTISDWKRKKLNPSVDKIPVICKVLNISADNLLGTDYVLADQGETILIEAYRSVDSLTQKQIITYAKSLSCDVVDGYVRASGAEESNLSPEKSQPTVTDITSTTPSIKAAKAAGDIDLAIAKNLTKRLRRLARLDRIKLDESMHQSGLNKHLFSYFDYIGIDKLTFIKEYLCHLQPFMISEIKSQEKFDNAICVLDEYYRISLYIKVDATKNEEIIVSFHENNKNGIAKRNSVITRLSDVYVFADSIGSHVKDSDIYSINLFITRGVRTFPISIAAYKYDDEGFMVHYRDISNALITIVNQYLEDLYTSDLDYSTIDVFSSLQQLSFTSYGNDIFSNISMLIDSLLIQSDSISKQVADSAICIYCNSLNLVESDRRELLETLSQRFSVNSVRIMPSILERIEANL